MSHEQEGRHLPQMRATSFLEKAKIINEKHSELFAVLEFIFQAFSAHNDP
jgi:hypothetical protein